MRTTTSTLFDVKLFNPYLKWKIQILEVKAEEFTSKLTCNLHDYNVIHNPFHLHMVQEYAHSKEVNHACRTRRRLLCAWYPTSYHLNPVWTMFECVTKAWVQVPSHHFHTLQSIWLYHHVTRPLVLAPTIQKRWLT